MLFKVKSWRIYMSSVNSHTLFNSLAADSTKNNCLATIYKVELIACLILLGLGALFKTIFLGKSDSFLNGFPFGFGSIKKVLILFAEFIRLFNFFLRKRKGCIFRSRKQLFFKQLSLGFLVFVIHFYHPFQA